MITLIRSEIVCFIILLYLFAYSLIYIEGIRKTRFIRMCSFGIAHVIFDLITIYTVNNIDKVDALANKCFHILFYYFAILFCYELFVYAVENVLPAKAAGVAKIVGRTVVAVYFVSAPFLEITYIKGVGTYYSFGMCVYVGYAVAMLFSTSSLVILFSNIKRLPKNTCSALIPTSCAMIAFMLIQIFIPEVLFTGAVVTIVSIGMFFVYENPVQKYKEKAYMDLSTGVKNRNCFDEDFSRYKKRLNALGYAENSMGVLLCDLNGLKGVNDNFGHAVGDKLIQAAAKVLLRELKSAKGVYRTGGDEFVALYADTDRDVIEAEIDAVYAGCRAESANLKTPLSLAAGYAVTSASEDLDAAYNTADNEMYRVKKAMKKERDFS